VWAVPWQWCAASDARFFTALVHDVVTSVNIVVDNLAVVLVTVSVILPVHP
jgi:hypothetical protein